MKINIRKLVGCWDLGYALDKHVLESVYLGDNEYGHPTFDTTRSDMGEALFQLKYRSQQSEIAKIAEQMAKSVPELFPGFDVVLPMPPSIKRRTQPVPQITKALAERLNASYRDGLLVKTSKTPQMKDIADRDEKVAALCDVFSVRDVLKQRDNDVLIVDDLFDTGSSLEAATITLREYEKIRRIYVVTATSKK